MNTGGNVGNHSGARVPSLYNSFPANKHSVAACPNYMRGVHSAGSK